MTPVIALPEIVLPQPGDHSAIEARPVLPGLSALFRGAVRLPSTSDWRAGVLAALGLRVQAAGSAAIAACAVAGLARGTGVCHAAPVHVVAGISRVFLGSTGQEVAAEEREAFREAFNVEFGAPDLRLHAVGAGWLLQAPCAKAADDENPEVLAGKPLSREPAREDAARQLRRLGTEVEMWLADHPLNRRRMQCGLPMLNAFWFWAGDTACTLPAPQQAPGCFATSGAADGWLTGLAAHCRSPVIAAAGWRAVPASPAPCIVMSPQTGAAAMQSLVQWDVDWFEPLHQDLQAGRLHGMRLQIGSQAWRLPAAGLRRWLGRRRPWWQVVA